LSYSSGLCETTPIFLKLATTVVATRCEFANSDYGAVVAGSLTPATFNNGRCGMFAINSGKVLIHLPSHHTCNTIYNNTRDRGAVTGGTITNVIEEEQHQSSTRTEGYPKTAKKIPFFTNHH